MKNPIAVNILYTHESKFAKKNLTTTKMPTEKQQIRLFHFPSHTLTQNLFHANVKSLTNP